MTHLMVRGLEQFKGWIDAAPLRYFESLGVDVETRWKSANYDRDSFTEIATETLSRKRPCDHISYEQILRSIVGAPTLPYQPNLFRFGQPPVAVFWSNRFYIEILHWTQGSTSIHEHGFSGAFSLLEGASIQTRYAYTLSTRHGPHLSSGDIRLLDATLLQKGDVEPIYSGRKLIHGVFHFGLPTISIVIRTPQQTQQFSYHWPHIAIDPFVTDHASLRRFELLEFADSIGLPVCGELISLAVRNSDIHKSYEFLSKLIPHCGVRSALFGRVAEAVRGQLGIEFDPMAASLKELGRQGVLERLGKGLHDSNQKFFLALLQMIPRRDQLVGLLRQRFSGLQPEEQILGWLLDLLPFSTLELEKDEITQGLLWEISCGVPINEILGKLAHFAGVNKGEEPYKRLQKLQTSPIIQSLVTAQSEA